MVKALVIPVEGPLYEIEIGPESLKTLQETVGGYIEALRLPSFIPGFDRSTAYVDEEGKFSKEPNMRATDFMVPGIGLFPGDYISGPFVLCGFNPVTGNHVELPQAVIDRARLIESEAS